MIETVGRKARSHSQDDTRDGPPIVWGHHARGLHDQLWAAHGMQVVRRGAGANAAANPTSYLLLDPDELVLFNPSDVLARLPRCRPGVLQVRISGIDETDYSEHVHADEADRLISVHRLYSAPSRSETIALITADRVQAQRWRLSSSWQTGRRAVRAAAGLLACRQTSCHGYVSDASDAALARRFLLLLVRHWRGIDEACLHVSELQPGIWIHHQARVEPGACLVSPVWIGAGVSIREGDVIVGPKVLEDEETVWPAPFIAAPWLLRLLPRPVDKVSPSDRLRRCGERLLSVAFALVALLLTAPLYPLIMFAIWREDGRPFFFAHKRQTLGGRDFNCYKFRTMYKNAENIKGPMAGSNMCDGPHFHVADDQRTLRIGRFLRRYQLDELPQFFNVLVGHMNVVGPRPSPSGENQFCPAWRDARLSVRPGITGLWQVKRTRVPNRDFQEWIRHDIEYIDRRCWRLNLWIILRTVAKVLSRCRRRAARC